MKYFKLFFLSLILISTTLKAQEFDNTELPYYEIQDYPEKYTAGSVAARMVDGLGFRYFWATEGLREIDLRYKPSEEGRTCKETIDHIYGLSMIILNATKEEVNDFTRKRTPLSYEKKRKKTLENLNQASNILKRSNADQMEKFKVIFKGNNGTSEYPFWNNINGPIADAIWHCGQVVLLRRSSGNPFNSKVSLLNGKLRE